jgi:hypothetical protein
VVNELLVHTLDILPTDGLPSPLTDGGMDQLNGLKDAIPKPALRLVLAQPNGQPLAEAVDLQLRYPSEKVRIVGVGGTGATALTEHSTMDTDTVRIFFLRDSTAPLPATLPGSELPRSESVMDVAFELMPGETAVTPADFTIVQQKSYDRDGIPLTGPDRVSKDGIF